MSTVNVVRAAASGAANSGLVPSRVKPITLNWYSQLPCRVENKPASLLVLPLEKALSGIPSSWCGNRQTNSRLLLSELVIALSSLSRDWRINTRPKKCLVKKYEGWSKFCNIFPARLHFCWCCCAVTHACWVALWDREAFVACLFMEIFIISSCVATLTISHRSTHR